VRENTTRGREQPSWALRKKQTGIAKHTLGGGEGGGLEDRSRMRVRKNVPAYRKDYLGKSHGFLGHEQEAKPHLREKGALS